MIIELAGLSGCGKSTISKIVSKQLRNQGLLVTNRDRILVHKYFLKFPPENTGLRWKILKGIYSNLPNLCGKRLVDTFFLASLTSLVCRFQTGNVELSQMILRDLAKNYTSGREKYVTLKMIYEVFAIYQMINELYRSNNNNTTVILDEGFCRVGRMIYARGDIQSFTEIQQFVQLMPLPNLVVYVDTEPSICISRLSRRYGSMDKVRDNPYIRSLEKGRQYLQMLCQELEKKGIPVLRINNNNNIEKTTNIVLEYLKRFLNNTR